DRASARRRCRLRRTERIARQRSWRERRVRHPAALAPTTRLRSAYPAVELRRVRIGVVFRRPRALRRRRGTDRGSRSFGPTAAARSDPRAPRAAATAAVQLGAERRLGAEVALTPTASGSRPAG